MKIIIASLAVITLFVCIALGIYYFMPAKTEWADDYRQYADTLSQDDPLRTTMEPMLTDGELSIWEITLIHCGEAKTCRLNNFTEVLLSPESADMFAQTVLASLKHQQQLATE